MEGAVKHGVEGVTEVTTIRTMDEKKKRQTGNTFHMTQEK